MTGLGVIHMDGQEATFVVMSVEQRQLLVAMDCVRRIVDIEDDGLRGFPMASAPQIHHSA
jgi:hypothetical protein